MNSPAQAPSITIDDQKLVLKILIRRLFYIKNLVSTPEHEATSLLDYLLRLAESNRRNNNQESLGFRSIDEIITEAIIRENIESPT